MPRPLMEYPWFAAINAQLHRLWTKAIGSDGYDKEEWKRFETSIETLAVAKRDLEHGLDPLFCDHPWHQNPALITTCPECGSTP